MADRKLFYEDAALGSVQTRVIETGTDQARNWVRLEETVFYPEGGGQPPDHGTIAGIAVVDVQSRGPQVLHYLERLPESAEVAAVIDSARRFDLRQQHTAQHLLTAILADRHALPTTSFHLGDSYTAIEVSGVVPGPDALRRMEAEVNAQIRNDLPVTARWVDPDELGQIGVRTRGLPEGHSGPVRIVEIEGLDRNTCGGTHVDRLGEIQLVHLLGAEPARGGARIRFLAGGRVVSELARVRSLEAELKRILGTSPDEFASALLARETGRRALERKLKDIEELLAEAVAAQIAAAGEQVAVRHLAGAESELLRSIAARVSEARPGSVVVLIGSFGEPGETAFVVQAGPDAPADVEPIFALVTAFLSARGGGKGRTRQGRGGRWPGDEAFFQLVGRIRGNG